MPLESALDFNSYVDTTTGHGVKATFFETQSTLWDARAKFIDSWYDIDTGDAYSVDIIIDQEYFNIGGGTVDVDGFQPRAVMKSTDAQYISHGDKLLVEAITTNRGNTLVPQTMFIVKTVEPDNTGLISLVLEEE
jgi:hypothetical protein